MNKKIEIYEEHGNVLYLNDGQTHVTFFREQVQFIPQEGSNDFILKIKPTSIEIKISQEDYFRLKDFSKPPSAQWFYMDAKSKLYDFFDRSIDRNEAKKKWTLLKKEMDDFFRSSSSD